MRAISTEGFVKPKWISAGATPKLQWLAITDLVVDSTYQPPIKEGGRRNVDRIARAFCWSCFAPIVVTPVEGGKFAIIDGQHRTTAAALVGFDSVPCQIVVATQEEQAVAFRAINGATAPISRMALYAAALVAREPWAVRLAEVCARAEVEPLRYPVPLDKQARGQTMAVGALMQCLRRYGEETLITALQCVTHTTNNRPGTLSACTIKALCDLLGGDHDLRDSGLALFEAFDAMDLMALQRAASVDARIKKISPVQAMGNRMRSELDRLLARKVATKNTIESSQGNRISFVRSNKHPTRAKRARQARKSRG
jgi:ParB-like nuclease domain